MRWESIYRLACKLQAAQVRYLVVGGVAVYAWGYERFTKDLDLVISLAPESIDRTFQVLTEGGYKPALALLRAEDLKEPGIRRRLIEEKNLTAVQFINEKEPDTSVDLLITEPFDFETEYAKAYVSELPGGAEVRIVWIDTLLDMKSRAGREQDLADVAVLRKLHGRPKT